MNQILSALHNNVVPSNMVEDIRVEEEAPGEEVNWRRVLAVSSLLFALILVGGAIYLHIKEQQLEQPQRTYQTKSLVGIGIPVAIAIAIDRKISKIPYKSSSPEQKTILYNNNYYEYNNNEGSVVYKGVDNHCDDKLLNIEDNNNDNNDNNNDNSADITNTILEIIETTVFEKSSDLREEVKSDNNAFVTALKAKHQTTTTTQQIKPCNLVNHRSHRVNDAMSNRADIAVANTTTTTIIASEICLQCIRGKTSERPSAKCAPVVFCGRSLYNFTAILYGRWPIEIADRYYCC